MNYGCIGEHLKHSFSKEIHARLTDYDYEIREIARDDLVAFMTRGDFRAINVTIPYKEAVIPHLYSIDEHARMIGAVNTIVNRDGRLYGYNTDFYGMSALIERLGLSLEGKKVVILGTGGTSKTADAVACAMGAEKILRVSRSGREGAITYEEMYERHTDAEIMINTTPVGMFPNIEGLAVDVKRFTRLEGVVDAVYNPLRTPLVREAMRMGVAAEGGLYMLVAQAVRASEIFLGITYPEGTLDRVFGELLAEKENVVLIGMPASGKSTVGALLGERLGRKLIDTDGLIVETAGTEIKEIFATMGEAHFREMEHEAVLRASAMTSVVIATGGGAILRDDNVDALRANGRLYFLDRSPDLLMPTDSRPLSSDRDAMMRRYNERYSRYCSVADERIDGDGTPCEVADKIRK